MRVRYLGRLCEGDGASSLLLLCVEKAGEMGVGVGVGGSARWRVGVSVCGDARWRRESCGRGMKGWGLGVFWVVWCMVDGLFGMTLWIGYPRREWDDDA